MRILSFAVRSYRSCSKTAFPLQTPLTALIGINGAGKSNIMNALLLLRKARIQRLYHHQRGESGNKCLLSAKFDHDGKEIDMKAEISYEIDDRNNDEVQFTHWKWNPSVITKKQKWSEFPLEIVGMGDKAQPILFQRQFWNMVGFSPSKLSKEEKELFPLLSEIVCLCA